MLSLFARPTRRITATLVAGLLVLGLTSGQAASAANYVEKHERTLVNTERQEHKRNSLRLHAKLSKIARKHSRRMANHGELYHNPNLAQQVQGMPWRVIAENVGVGPDLGDADASVQMVHDAFMDSAPHRKNILLRKVRKVGVGVVASGGNVWVTIVFMG